MKNVFSIVLGVGLLLGLAAAPTASAAIIYQNNNTYVLNGTSDIYVGNYGLSSPSATYVVQASATWASNSVFAEMLFNTVGGSSGPDLYFISGAYCGTSQVGWNTYNFCDNKLASMPAAANDGNLHTWTLVDDSVANNTALYFDGTLIGTAGYATPGNNLTIGGDANGFFWTGTISGFTVYSTALTANEVAALPSAQSAPEPSAMALLAVALAGVGAIRRRST